MQEPRVARKLPVEVSAIRWNGLNTEQVKAFVGERQRYGPEAVPTGTGKCGFLLSRQASERVETDRGEAVVFDRFHGWVPVRLGDWIIRGVRGEFYPCDPEAFDGSYEFVDPLGDAVVQQGSKSAGAMM